MGAEKSFDTAVADDLRFVAKNVGGAVIANSGHWLMEEQPTAAVAVIRYFSGTEATIIGLLAVRSCEDGPARS